jgi:voltage-gated potassium channel
MPRMNPFRIIYRGLARIANSPRLLAVFYVSMLVVASALYSVFENKSIVDSVWWSIVTASTVGYGDTYPTHPAGRVVAGVLITVMVLVVIPLVTAHFASKLIVDHDAFKHEEQEELKNNLRQVRELLEQLARDRERVS